MVTTRTRSQEDVEYATGPVTKDFKIFVKMLWNLQDVFFCSGQVPEPIPINFYFMQLPFDRQESPLRFNAQYSYYPPLC